jgi:hypothetical protein
MGNIWSDDNFIPEYRGPVPGGNQPGQSPLQRPPPPARVNRTIQHQVRPLNPRDGTLQFHRQQYDVNDLDSMRTAGVDDAPEAAPMEAPKQRGIKRPREEVRDRLPDVPPPPPPQALQPPPQPLTREEEDIMDRMEDMRDIYGSSAKRRRLNPDGDNDVVDSEIRNVDDDGDSNPNETTTTTRTTRSWRPTRLQRPIPNVYDLTTEDDTRTHVVRDIIEGLARPDVVRSIVEETFNYHDPRTIDDIVNRLSRDFRHQVELTLSVDPGRLEYFTLVHDPHVALILPNDTEDMLQAKRAGVLHLYFQDPAFMYRRMFFGIIVHCIAYSEEIDLFYEYQAYLEEKALRMGMLHVDMNEYHRRLSAMTAKQQVFELHDVILRFLIRVFEGMGYHDNPEESYISSMGLHEFVIYSRHETRRITIFINPRDEEPPTIASYFVQTRRGYDIDPRMRTETYLALEFIARTLHLVFMGIQY